MKKKKCNPKPTFIPYDQRIITLFPSTWDEYIDEKHPVRIVNAVVDSINIDKLIETYPGGGRANYNPRLLLKLLIFGYLSNVYSSRKLEAFAKESIYCHWLTNLQIPDHNTINRFRGNRLKDTLKGIFVQIGQLLADAGLISLEDVYLDGTKIEANANKYTFVWGKSIKNYKAKIGKKLEEVWNYAESVNKEEMAKSQPPDFAKVDPEMVKNTIETINAAVAGKEISKEVKKKLNDGEKNWAKKVAKYQQQEEILGKRGSYSKTDPDATFMRTKDDHLNQGQLKPCYNLQITTNNQIVLNYSIHPNPTDTTTLPGHMNDFKQLYGRSPDKLIADAGYGSEENYKFLEKEGIQAYVKYNTFHQEISGKKKKIRKPFGVENLYYDKEKDCYYCPMGQPMRYIGDKRKTTENGYTQQLKQYKAINCNGCPIKGVCHQGEAERVIDVNHRLNKLRNTAKDLLISEEGIKYRIKRNIEVETTFGDVKHNMKFRRLLLRGKEKVGVEIGLVLLAHNIKKAGILGFNLRKRRAA